MISVEGKVHIYQVIHEVIPHDGDRQVKQVDLMNRILVRLADTVVLRNRKYVHEMVARYGISAHRIKFLELWRRFPGFTPSSNTKELFFFGRINPYKGADNLLSIVQKCPGVRFNVVGRADSRVGEILNQLSNEKNTFLNIGYVTNDEMKRSFTNCDWVIVPYNSASQSGVIIDAYKYSRPVIAFNVGAISEQIVDGKSGYLINPGDICAFSNMIKKVVSQTK